MKKTPKLQLKDAVIYYEQFLVQNDLVAPESFAVITQEAILLGDEIYHRMIVKRDEIYNGRRTIYDT